MAGVRRVFGAIFLVMAALGAARVAAEPADELAGLWKAQRLHGPVARGTLIIDRDGGDYVADMMGRRLPVAVDEMALSFKLPDGEGEFRGALQKDGAIAGHWYPPRTVVSGNWFWFASPVRLEPSGKNRWSGEVTPLDDTFTLYLKIEKRADGTLGTFLRNPERNMGVFMNIDRLVRDGDRVKLVGKQLGRNEESDLFTGRYHQENDILTIDWPQRGGSYDFRREGDHSHFYPRGKNGERYSYAPPLARNDGWPVGTLEEAGIDRDGMERFVQAMIDMPMDSVDAPEVHGILVARHGKLVLEEYFHGEHRDKMHDTRSAAKSLTSTLVGAALQAGAPLKLSTPVYEVMNGGEFPEGLEPLKKAMTLEHLLTTSSGYFCDDTNPDAPGNEDTMIDQREEPDFYRFTMRVPMAFPPGERSIYCSANHNLALGVVGRAAGESPMALFDRLLGRPMQIERYGWILDPSSQPYGGGSVNFLPRDFMKLGQLMLDGGVWKGKRLLPRDFVERASSPIYHLRNVYYGYSWWVFDFPYKDRTVRGYWAGGNGGQGVTVFPELDLVIATYGGSFAARQGIHIQQEIPVRYILPAVREAGDDSNAPVAFNDWVSPYGRSPLNTVVTAGEHAAMEKKP
jgi:CubicO group peptidase (beta-lactamase class C family)